MRIRLFDLTVAEQRVIVVVLLVVVGLVAAKSYRQEKDKLAPNEFAQPSPSPGILP